MSENPQKIYQISLNVGESMSHFGGDSRGIGVENVQEFLHSDTLFSAICCAWGEMYGKDDVEGAFKRFEAYQGGTAEHPPFRLSSAFLSARGAYYLPRPLIPLPRYRGPDPDLRQAVDRLFRRYGARIEDAAFLRMDEVRRWLADRTGWNEKDYTDFYEGAADGAGAYSGLFVRLVRPVNSRDRARARTVIFHRGEVAYGKDTGLYFFLKTDPETVGRIEDILRALSVYGGFGGERGVGFGAFALERVEDVQHSSWREFFEPGGEATGSYLLSLWHPDGREQAAGGYYDLIWRKGWFQSPFSGYQFKKQTLPMAAEGSVFPVSEIRGSLVEVTPKVWAEKKDSAETWHPIYRYSIPLTVPVRCEV